MSLDNFDKKIQQVTENNLPAFNESDWEKMEILLDKNLPVKKDRRRFLFFLFSFLLLGLLFGGIYFYNKSTNIVVDSSAKKLKPTDADNAENGIAKETNSIDKINTTSTNPVSTKGSIELERNDETENVVNIENTIADKTSPILKNNVHKQIGIIDNNNFKKPANKLINTARSTDEEIENKNAIKKLKQRRRSTNKLNEDVSGIMV